MAWLQTNLGNKFFEIWVMIWWFLFKKMQSKISARWLPFCSDLKVWPYLTHKAFPTEGNDCSVNWQLRLMLLCNIGTTPMCQAQHVSEYSRFSCNTCIIHASLNFDALCFYIVNCNKESEWIFAIVWRGFIVSFQTVHHDAPAPCWGSRTPRWRRGVPSPSPSGHRRKCWQPCGQDLWWFLQRQYLSRDYDELSDAVRHIGCKTFRWYLVLS